MERFDRYKWEPKLFETPQEIDSAISTFGIREKKIKEVHVIGAGLNMLEWAYTRDARRLLASVGVPYEQIDSGEYPLDTVLLPYEVMICEPVVILFTDDSTFEVMPNGSNGLFMSVDQISKDTLDGTNDHNFNSVTFFECLKGRSIDSVQTIKRKTISFHGYEEVRENITFQFHLKGKGCCDEKEDEKEYEDPNKGFYFRQIAKTSIYMFGVTMQNWFSDLGNRTASVRLSKIKEVAYNNRQILIYEGGQGGSCHDIQPVKRTKVTKQYWDGFKHHPSEHISIEEEDVYDYLYCFLKKGFDESNGDEFDSYLDENIYTYSSVEEMLSEIEKSIRLLKEDFDNTGLDELKEHFKALKVQVNVDRIIDFYDRFVWRMRLMMKHAPDYKLILFTGP